MAYQVKIRKKANASTIHVQQFLVFETVLISCKVASMYIRRAKRIAVLCLYGVDFLPIIRRAGSHSFGTFQESENKGIESYV